MRTWRRLSALPFPLLLAGALLVGPLPNRPVLAQDAEEGTDEAESEDEGSKWSVEEPGGPYRTLEFETTEGTWTSVDVHPDGTRLVFDILGDLYTVPIAGGEASALTSGLAYDTQPRWSPDGTHVLFTSDRGGGDNVWVANADGTEPRAVTKEKFRLLNNGSWHPSGEFVVARKHFTSRRSIGAGEMWTYQVGAKGGRDGVQLTKRKNDQQDAGEPVFSPDGKYLYWAEDMSGGETFQYNKDPNGVIYVIRRLDMQTGEVRDVIRRPGGAVRPQPSPDGRHLAFVRRNRGKSVLALLDIESGEMRDLWDGLSIDQQETWAIFGPYPGYDWTPDGRSIVIWAKGGLHRVDVASGKATKIEYRAKVKQRILETRRIEHSVTGDMDVRVIRWPQVTPDGKTAVFQALGRLYRRDLASGEVARITSQDEIECAPRLSRDGRSVVYVTWSDARGGFVRQVDVAGGQPRTLVSRPGHYVSASPSHDGKEVVYHRGGGDQYRGRRWTEEPGIYRVKVGENATPRFVTRQGRKPRFSADGRRILLVARAGERAALVSVDRIGSDRRVHATSEHANHFELSPDGRWLAFEELWQTYVVPLPPGPTALEVGPKTGAVPVRRLSSVAGTYLSWSADSKTVRWSLGPDIFEADASAALATTPEKGDDERGVGAPARRLGWSVASDAPDTDVYLVGATIVPMHDMSIIERGVVHVQGNRIMAVGTADEVPVPEGANTIEVWGKTLIPGLVDVHSHTGSSNGGIHSEQNWAFLAMLAFGVTTSHDPSNNTQMIYAESEMVRTGSRLGPRILSTGTILYGAEGDFKSVVNSYEDALQEVRRTAAWGPRSVKSYQQPRRDQRQQVLKAAAETGIMVMPEGGSSYHQNISQIIDGHTTMEHAIPIAPLYEPDLRLFAESGTCYTPTLVVGYGGLWGENYWYARTRVWDHERLLRFVPKSVVDPKARRRTLATAEDEYHHFRLARTAADIYARGGTVEIGAHGQLQGLAAHWETWMLEQGGLTPHEALRCATWGGARAICLDHEIGSVQPGHLADLLILDGKPLENIRDSEKVIYTMVNGRLYDAATLEQILPERVKLPAGPPLDTLDPSPGHANCACGR